MRSILLLLCLAALGQLYAQPPGGEFDFPSGCVVPPTQQFQFIGEIKINGADASTDDWVAVFDDGGNVIGRGKVVSGDIGFGVSTYITMSLSAETTVPPAGCPANYGGFDDVANDANDEFVDIVLWDEDTNSFLTTSAVSFQFDIIGVLVTGPDGLITLPPDLYDFIAPYAPLPVEFLYFRAQTQETAVQLDWATANEIDNDFFEVQHSTDGRTFSPIGQVNGVGTTEAEQRYQFTHTSPGTGINYYRLRQVDFDGAFDYSDIVTVDFFRAGAQEEEIRLFPNPTSQNEVHIAVPSTWRDGEVVVVVRDLTGRVLQQTQMGLSPILNLSLADLPTGLYLVELNNGNTIEVARLLKE